MQVPVVALPFSLADIKNAQSHVDKLESNSISTAVSIIRLFQPKLSKEGARFLKLYQFSRLAMLSLFFHDTRLTAGARKAAFEFLSCHSHFIGNPKYCYDNTSKLWSASGIEEKRQRVMKKMYESLSITLQTTSFPSFLQKGKVEEWNQESLNESTPEVKQQHALLLTFILKLFKHCYELLVPQIKESATYLSEVKSKNFTGLAMTRIGLVGALQSNDKNSYANLLSILEIYLTDRLPALHSHLLELDPSAPHVLYHLDAIQRLGKRCMHVIVAVCERVAANLNREEALLCLFEQHPVVTYGGQLFVKQHMRKSIISQNQIFASILTLIDSFLKRQNDSRLKEEKVSKRDLERLADRIKVLSRQNKQEAVTKDNSSFFALFADAIVASFSEMVPKIHAQTEEIHRDLHVELSTKRRQHTVDTILKKTCAETFETVAAKCAHTPLSCEEMLRRLFACAQLHYQHMLQFIQNCDKNKVLDETLSAHNVLSDKERVQKGWTSEKIGDMRRYTWFQSVDYVKLSQHLHFLSNTISLIYSNLIGSLSSFRNKFKAKQLEEIEAANQSLEFLLLEEEQQEEEIKDPLPSKEKSLQDREVAEEPVEFFPKQLSLPASSLQLSGNPLLDLCTVQPHWYGMRIGQVTVPSAIARRRPSLAQLSMHREMFSTRMMHTACELHKAIKQDSSFSIKDEVFAIQAILTSGYLSLEQGATHFILTHSPHQKVVHSLRRLYSDKVLGSVDKENIWIRNPRITIYDRYPYIFLSPSRTAPFALRLIRQANEEAVKEFNETQALWLRDFFALKRALVVKSSSEASVKQIDAIMEMLGKEKESIDMHSTSKELTVADEKSLHQTVDQLEGYLTKQKSTEDASKKQEAEDNKLVVLSNALYHLKQLQGWINLLKRRPKQCFFALQLNRIVLATQYFVRNVGIVLSIQQQDEFWSHRKNNLDDYVIYGLYEGLSKRNLETMQAINIRKASEYFFSTVTHTSPLMALLEEYNMRSWCALLMGDGATPSSMAEKSIATQQQEVTEWVQRCIHLTAALSPKLYE